MPSVEVNAILLPISADAPCGIDLEEGSKYDPAFAELERAAVGKPEQQIGNTLVPAESPDWKIVQRKSMEVLAKSKDLRAATHLARSLLHTDGWSGFSRGLEVLAGLVDQYWEGMYPRLDPEDDNDPTMRINILLSITEPAVLSVVRGTPLVSSRSLGRYSLKDLESVAGDPAADSSGDQASAMASIEAAVMDAELPALEETASAVRACRAAIVALEAAIANRVASPDSLSFTKLATIVRKAETFLAARLAQRAPAEAAVGANGAGGIGPGGNGHGSGVDMGSMNGSAAGPEPGAGQAVWSSGSGGIKSRDDVLRALNAISAYYEKHEPSSPIPLFMARCKRLVTMSFVDIVRDLVPDALAQVDVLRGRVE